MGCACACNHDERLGGRGTGRRGSWRQKLLPGKPFAHRPASCNRSLHALQHEQWSGWPVEADDSGMWPPGARQSDVMLLREALATHKYRLARRAQQRLFHPLSHLGLRSRLFSGCVKALSTFALDARKLCLCSDQPLTWLHGSTYAQTAIQRESVLEQQPKVAAVLRARIDGPLPIETRPKAKVGWRRRATLLSDRLTTSLTGQTPSLPCSSPARPARRHHDRSTQVRSSALAVNFCLGHHKTEAVAAEQPARPAAHPDSKPSSKLISTLWPGLIIHRGGSFIPQCQQ
jgi:hypothetical protein